EVPTGGTGGTGDTGEVPTGGTGGTGGTGDTGGTGGTGDTSPPPTGDTSPPPTGDTGLVGADAIAPGELVINELIQDPNAVDDGDGEWFEVYNASGRTLDLDGLIVRDDGVDGFVVSGPLPVPAGGYLVFGINADPVANGGVSIDYAYSGMILGNADDEIVLENAGGIIDAIAYDDGATFPDPTGVSTSLDPGYRDAISNDNGAYWCPASSAFGAGDHGTPGTGNDPCIAPTGDTNALPTGDTNALPTGDTNVLPTGDTNALPTGDTNVLPTGDTNVLPTGDTGLVLQAAGLQPGDLVINEIIQNPAAVADGNGEWFEVYNASGQTVDLEGLIVRDDGGESFTVTGPLLTPAGGYLVFGVNSNLATNGGVVVDYDYNGMFLSNADDEIVLEAPGGVVIDAVAYDGVTWIDPTGASMSLDPGHRDAISNDNSTYWCEATTPFGDGDLGTPGAANDACP
ncbi:MAG TPA: lamin tail domain-containing protein, partial [Deltaproteobacteria bacterium]|nr:lamin tail domain-containing protein [Deltaproteobacteria bacterium]